MQIIRALVYIPNEEDLEQRYKTLTDTDNTDSYFSQYTLLFKHFQTLWKRKSEWALSHRVTAITRGNYTNNLALEYSRNS